MIVNIIYLVVIAIYSLPMAACLLSQAFEANGITYQPWWMNDTSWKGFFLSPIRMWKKNP